jgi:predicted amidohydrolase
MFDVQLRPGEEYRESERYDAGDTFELVSDHAIRVGLTICYDMRFPEGYRSLAREGAEVIAIPSSFTETTGTAHWHVLTRARAIESGCFILAPAQGGKHADGRETYGHSLIIDPWGRVLAEAGTEPCVIHADLDLDQVEAARARIPSLRHDRRYTIHHSRLRVPLDRND